MRKLSCAGALMMVGLAVGAAFAASEQSAPRPTHPLAQEHSITVDATAITPAKAWSIPGITEPLQSLTPSLTNEVKTLRLRPGRYVFMTTSFSFDFTVNLDGKLDYAKMHDQCVTGRGTDKLTVNCRFTMPQS